MSKKTKSSLGRSLIKDIAKSRSGKRFVDNKSMLHTTELQDGYDWGRLNLQSVTEESSFQEFLSTAELAGAEFQAEKLNIQIVNSLSNVGLLSKDEIKKVQKDHEKYKDLLRIPRRPSWTPETTPEQLDQNEKAQFLEWRRGLAKLQEDYDCLLTPYEKNLEFWRQLWRVVERSDVVVQIVDARNPLLFRCEDLEKYVKEVSINKINLILVNKADLLTETQRQAWADYFSSLNLRAIFFSAVLASEEQNDISNSKDDLNSNEVKDTEEINIGDNSNASEKIKKEIDNLEENVEKTAEKLDEILIKMKLDNFSEINNSSELLTRGKLIELFRTIHSGPKVSKDVTTIGLVGYPNVGKSSTINSLFTEKKVSVSATPGKTKHFQTLFFDKDILLCDCPGLVMPTFVFTKAEMITNGILPIDQMRDHVPPISLVCNLIPRHVLEDKYGIMLPPPLEAEDPDRCPTSEELLNAYGYNRGFMTSNGQPDNPRSARYVLKDFVNGKLLYCHAPPGILQEAYHTWPERQKIIPADKVLPPRTVRAIKPYGVSSADFDKAFFQSNKIGVHSKGVIGKAAGIPESLRDGSEGISEKLRKKPKKHANKKREKSRRVYAHLDQH